MKPIEYSGKPTTSGCTDNFSWRHRLVLMSGDKQPKITDIFDHTRNISGQSKYKESINRRLRTKVLAVQCKYAESVRTTRNQISYKNSFRQKLLLKISDLNIFYCQIINVTIRLGLQLRMAFPAQQYKILNYMAINDFVVNDNSTEHNSNFSYLHCYSVTVIVGVKRAAKQTTNSNLGVRMEL